MASIDDIWDAPVTNSPKTSRLPDSDDDASGPHRPAKRQKQALFLSDSEGEGDEGGIRRGVVKAPPPVADSAIDEEVEALFADAENDPALSFKKIGDFDVDAMEREAEERHRRPSSPRPHAVMPSSSPTRDTGAGAPNNDKAIGKDGKKRPRPVPLNENLLLGPTGFPDLISQVKDFKVKGKGRELEDLTRLMRVYNFWTHKLHPKLKFRDTVIRIEKLCHAKRMQVAMSVWKDEAHGKARELDADLSPDSDNDDEGPRTTTASNRGIQHSGNATSDGHSSPLSVDPGSDTRRRDRISLPPSSRASSQPPTSDFPDEDDIFGPSASSTSRSKDTSTTSTSTAAQKRRVVDDDDDDEEDLWKQLEATGTKPSGKSTQSLKASQSLDDFDDAEMWAALEEATTGASKATGKPVPGKIPATSGDMEGMDIDDDEMWDIIRENEKAAPASRPPVIEPTGATQQSTHNRPTGGQTLPDSEMDWDDMYAS